MGLKRYLASTITYSLDILLEKEDLVVKVEDCYGSWFLYYYLQLEYRTISINVLVLSRVCDFCVKQ